MKDVWLVTGGAGYIGSHVVATLISAGNQVVVLDDLSTGSKSFIPEEARLVVGSILDLEKLDQALNLAKDISKKFSIMHIAGLKLAGESMHSPEKYWKVNAQGTLNLVSQASKFEIERIVFSSSCSVYGNAGESFVSEIDGLHPESTYAKTKLTAEQIIQDYGRVTGTPNLALRYFNVAGTGLANVIDYSKENLFPALMNSLQNGSGFTIHGNTYETRDGTCIRDYLHVADLARGHQLAGQWLKGKHGISEVINLGTGTGTSVLEIVEKFNEKAVTKIGYDFGPKRSGDPASITANPQKARELLDWYHLHSLDEMVSSVIKVSANLQVS